MADGLTIGLDRRITWLHDDAPVVVLDPSTGEVADRWGEAGRNSGELYAGCEISVDIIGNDYILGCDPRRTQVFSAEHQLIAGAYAPNDQIFLPVFGSKGEVHATDYFAIDDIYVLKDSLLTP